MAATGTTDSSAAAARRLHHALERYHGMVYFVPEGRAEYRRLGLTGRMGYFASRSAAFGAVGPDVVIATFFNFHPDLVRAALPEAWTRAEPARVLTARLTVADGALRRLLGARIGDADVADAAALARRAADACRPHGRPLYAAHAQLPWPDEPHLQLWHAATLLREFRGDGHIACLVEGGLDPVDALVLHAAHAGGMPSRQVLQATRAWTDDEWASGVERLAARGWVDDDGSITDAGRGARDSIERRTDELATAPWEVLDEQEVATLVTVGRELSRTIAAAGTFGPV